MIILTLSNIVKSFGVNTVLKDVSLTLQQGQKMGLVGVNGSGKSTLFKIIAGLDSADGGTISIARGMRVGYLAQQGMVTSGNTVWAELEQVFAPVFALEERIHALEHEIAASHADENAFARLDVYKRQSLQRCAQRCVRCMASCAVL